MNQTKNIEPFRDPDGERIDALVQAISEISFGAPDGGWGGLEGLSIAVAGEGLETPLGPAVREGAEAIGQGLADVADAIRQLADARGKGNDE
ncbi:hypothetical protein GCM10009789_87780 [Kribbella sancticallisti]|uniref:Uncharacterized protein n=1 Tax=Kribbella sancticallisti TaxID=460087 RepID=A0ABP4QUW4_9ACTN